jgi:pyruvate,orthophosphate dikinase
MSDKFVYAFGGGTAEGRGDQKVLLGGKGAGLAQMSGLGIPVPPGFTITTEACQHYHAHGGEYPDGLRDEVRRHLAQLEQLQGKRFGDGDDPLLLSVRSGGPTSMPGMMDTVLNLGLNDAILAELDGNGVDPRFFRDCYRRLLTMYGTVVLDAPHHAFEEVLREAREKAGVRTDYELSAEQLQEVVEGFERVLETHGRSVPQEPEEQLWGAIDAVFESWNNARARNYRRLHRIPEDWGTAVNVQVMVFGNRGEDCATGVAFTRNPASGEKRVYGEFLINAQGEDVVAGIRTPQEINPTDGDGLRGVFPEAYDDLERICSTLEDQRRDMQDVEFTIEGRKLYMLQTRDGKRTGPAAVRIAVDMVEEGMIDRSEALRRIEGDHLVQMLAPEFDREEKQAAIDRGSLLATGLAAGPGAASGRIAHTADRAEEMAADGPVILVRDETSPEDIVGMHASAGILTSRGGMTSHAAVVARGMGKPCIVGAGDLHVYAANGTLRAGDNIFQEGDLLSIDGSTGEVLSGRLAARESEVLQALRGGADAQETTAVHAFNVALEWADEARRMKVRTNADTPEDAAVARTLGAEGIGLCRTEHMFFEEDRIDWVRQLILTDDEGLRQQALSRLLPMQQEDFAGIFRAMAGLPVTVRLLDPPLHEFLPHDATSQQRVARQMGIGVDAIVEQTEALSEANPMLGHRGCRLGLSTPSIYEMQVEAIARATVGLRRESVDARPEIMVPLVGVEEEMIRLRKLISGVLQRVEAEEGVELGIPIGTMIEVPRAALVADRIARWADSFSFGTNDLTQMTYGYSRDDVGRFLPDYIRDGILPSDPFAQLDAEGVGQLVGMACEKGRARRAELKIGICGEHGGDPSSVVFFDRTGLDYVSCSPYRVPVARLAAARASLGHGAGGKETS